ncbi:hypothetical protein SAMN05216464_110143 [Mucilaginibacter pineti]|uniref:Leucine rich repeat-containing protein n=1 Tax=Mucilaginibacter pineti TaxID=1391627 RepID=A0A1G7GH36_9SPHI|nr:hypothetical protein [Mucilaginibacter pineti]SDE87468.1 hypothetical protein SAMN05216464_110143 [Mucilaginibacter pineti]
MIKHTKIILKPENSSISKAAEVRLEGFTITQLEAFPWEDYRNLTSLNLVFCEAVTLTLIKTLPKQLTSLMANIGNLDVLADQVWKDKHLTKLHLNGKWNTPHSVIEEFDHQHPQIDFSFYHPQDDSYHNSFEFRQSKWEFQYFK